MISFQDGGRRLLVGGQWAADKEGNVVGKGDMRRSSSVSAKKSGPASKRLGKPVRDHPDTGLRQRRHAFKKNADVLARYMAPNLRPSR